MVRAGLGFWVGLGTRRGKEGVQQGGLKLEGGCSAFTQPASARRLICVLPPDQHAPHTPTPTAPQVGVLVAGQLQAAGKKGKGRKPAPPAANGSAADRASSGVAEALAEGLQEAETAPDLDQDGAGAKKED